jgi:hypothetical protein
VSQSLNNMRISKEKGGSKGARGHRARCAPRPAGKQGRLRRGPQLCAGQGQEGGGAAHGPWALCVTNPQSHVGVRITLSGSWPSIRAAT